MLLKIDGCVQATSEGLPGLLLIVEGLSASRRSKRVVASTRRSRIFEK